MIIKKIIYVVHFLLLIVVLAGCASTSSTPDQAKTLVPTVEDVTVMDIEITVKPDSYSNLEPYVFKTSEPEKITLQGRLTVMDPLLMIPDPDDGIFLVPIPDTGSGPSAIPFFEIGEVPQADVDERTGEYVFINIEPGRYAIVVLTKGGTQIPTRYMDGGQYAIFTLTETDRDQTIEIMKLRLP